MAISTVEGFGTETAKRKRDEARRGLRGVVAGGAGGAGVLRDGFGRRWGSRGAAADV